VADRSPAGEADPEPDPPAVAAPLTPSGAPRAADALSTLEIDSPASSSARESGGAPIAALREHVAILAPATRACADRGPQSQDHFARCACDAVCAHTFSGVVTDGGEVAIRYPFFGGDGLAYTIRADGTVPRCTYDFRDVHVSVECGSSP
jgi:hypothetical protein